MNEKLYMEMTIQVIFLSQSIYGLYSWSKVEGGAEVVVNKLPFKRFLKELFITLTIALLIGLVLDINTETQQPYIDAIASSLGLLGTWYLTKKYMESWLLWFIVDLLLIRMFLHQELFLSASFYILMSFFSIKGYFNWSKELSDDIYNYKL
jgi:nicotinamide mononucleotide transporter